MSGKEWFCLGETRGDSFVLTCGAQQRRAETPRPWKAATPIPCCLCCVHAKYTLSTFVVAGGSDKRAE
jgi:hypothetical protein